VHPAAARLQAVGISITLDRKMETTDFTDFTD
jgi:hypothetical protein